MRYVAFTLLLAATPLGAQRGRPIVNFPGLTAPVWLDTAGYVVKISASPSRVFGKLRLEYAKMEVPVTLDDSLNGLIGTMRMLGIRRLAGMQLSRSLNCGGGMSGPLADNARVQLAFVTMVKPLAADTSEVRTVLVGVATSLEGASRDAVRCNSEGSLEARLHERIAKAVLQP